jgi:ATP-dependent Clp protease protease subunit
MHQPSAGFEGQATDIEIHAREVLKPARASMRSTRKHTGKPSRRSTTTWSATASSPPQQAAEYGLIDRVLTSH